MICFIFICRRKNRFLSRFSVTSHVLDGLVYSSIAMSGKSEKKIKEIAEKKVQDSEEEPNLRGDYGNILILFFLYVLQGKSSLQFFSE